MRSPYPKPQTASNILRGLLGFQSPFRLINIPYSFQFQGTRNTSTQKKKCIGDEGWVFRSYVSCVSKSWKINRKSQQVQVCFCLFVVLGGLGLGFRVWGLGFGVWGLGFRDVGFGWVQLRAFELRGFGLGVWRRT